MSRPHFWIDQARARDFVLLSLHASVSHGQLVMWVYVGGFGIGVDL